MPASASGRRPVAGSPLQLDADRRWCAVTRPCPRCCWTDRGSMLEPAMPAGPATPGRAAQVATDAGSPCRRPPRSLRPRRPRGSSPRSRGRSRRGLGAMASAPGPRDVQVVAAHAGAADLHDHVERPWTWVRMSSTLDRSGTRAPTAFTVNLQRSRFLGRFLAIPMTGRPRHNRRLFQQAIKQHFGQEVTSALR